MNFDMLAETYGVEKIKTLGDCYMACCGASRLHRTHPPVVSVAAATFSSSSGQMSGHQVNPKYTSAQRPSTSDCQ